jgi:hypothetical protein
MNFYNNILDFKQITLLGVTVYCSEGVKTSQFPERTRYSIIVLYTRQMYVIIFIIIVTTEIYYILGHYHAHCTRVLDFIVYIKASLIIFDTNSVYGGGGLMSLASPTPFCRLAASSSFRCTQRFYITLCHAF